MKRSLEPQRQNTAGRPRTQGAGEEETGGEEEGEGGGGGFARTRGRSLGVASDQWH